MQRFFGLNLDRLGEDFSAFHAGSCLACVPAESALVAAVASDEKHGGGIEGIETESVPLDQFRDWYENTEFKEVEGWQETL